MFPQPVKVMGVSQNPGHSFTLSYRNSLKTDLQFIETAEWRRVVVALERSYTIESKASF